MTSSRRWGDTTWFPCCGSSHSGTRSGDCPAGYTGFSSQLDLDKIYYRGMEGGLSEERRAKPTRSHRTCLISLTVIFENFCDMWTCEEHYKEMQYSEFIGNLSHRCPVHSRYQWSILTQKQACNINHTDCAHSLGCAPFLWGNGWNLPEKQFLRCQVKANFVTARLWGKAYLVLWAFMDRMDRVLSILHC